MTRPGSASREEIATPPRPKEEQSKENENESETREGMLTKEPEDETGEGNPTKEKEQKDEDDKAEKADEKDDKTKEIYTKDDTGEGNTTKEKEQKDEDDKAEKADEKDDQKKEMNTKNDTGEGKPTKKKEQLKKDDEEEKADEKDDKKKEMNTKDDTGEGKPTKEKEQLKKDDEEEKADEKDDKKKETNTEKERDNENNTEYIKQKARAKEEEEEEENTHKVIDSNEKHDAAKDEENDERLSHDQKKQQDKGEEERDEETDKGNVDTQCGVGPCRLPGLQRCATLMFFTVTLSLTSLFIIMQGPLLSSQVTSIERQFELKSSQVGTLMSANDMGFLLLVLAASHAVKHAHAPRLLGMTSTAFGVAALLIAATNFMQPLSLQLSHSDYYSNASSNGSGGSDRSTEDRYLCTTASATAGDNNGTSSSSSFSADDMCDSQAAEKKSAGNLLLAVLFGSLLAAQGVVKAIRSPLGVTFIDNNVPHVSKTGFYVGIHMTLTLFGPPLGFALGGLTSQIPVDLSETSMSSSDPRWVGAWWLGFVVCGSGVLLFSIPTFFFPRRLPDRRPSDTSDAVNLGQDEKRRQDAEAASKFSERTNGTSPQKEALARRTASKDTIATRNKGAGRTHGEAARTVERYTLTSSLAKTEPSGDNNTHFNGATAAAQADTGFNTAGKKDEHAACQTDETCWSVLKEMPVSMLRLVKNPVYVLLLLALGVHLFALIGFSSFLIKFVARQFDIPPHLGSYIFGLSNLVFSGLGTFVGGVLVSRAQLTKRGCLRWILAAGCLSAVLSAVTLGLGCDDDPIVGLGHSETFAIDDGLKRCECDVTQFLPVCDGNRTFLSPCHAGCSQSSNATHFEDCALAAERRVSVGVCSPGCHFLVPFIVVQVLSGAIGATTITPCYVTILRSIAKRDKTLGLGLLSFALSLIGFLPSPIVFGAVIDTACRVWSSTCGRSGACALYDITQLRHRYIGVAVGAHALAQALFALALLALTWQIRTGRAQDAKPSDKEDDEKDEPEQQEVTKFVAKRRASGSLEMQGF